MSVQEHPAATEEQSPDDHFLTKSQVLKLLPISRTQLWILVRQGIVPPPQMLGNKSVWLSSSIHRVMNSLPTRRYKNMRGG